MFASLGNSTTHIYYKAHHSATNNTKEGRYKTYINYWNSTDHPNVINIAVSATAFNLMTSKSRFENHQIGYNKTTSKYEVFENQTAGRNFTKKSYLYDIKWSLGCNEEYKIGRRVRLMVRLL